MSARLELKIHETRDSLDKLAQTMEDMDDRLEQFKNDLRSHSNALNDIRDLMRKIDNINMDMKDKK